MLIVKANDVFKPNPLNGIGIKHVSHSGFKKVNGVESWLSLGLVDKQCKHYDLAKPTVYFHHDVIYWRIYGIDN